jgi:hypothetical protein
MAIPLNCASVALAVGVAHSRSIERCSVLLISRAVGGRGVSIGRDRLSYPGGDPVGVGLGGFFDGIVCTKSCKGCTSSNLLETCGDDSPAKKISTTGTALLENR